MTENARTSTIPSEAEIQAEIAAGVAANKLVLVEGRYDAGIAFKAFLPGVSAEKVVAYIGADTYVSIDSQHVVHASEGRSAGFTLPTLADIIRHQQRIAHAEERELATLKLCFPGGEHNLWNNLKAVASAAGVQLLSPPVRPVRRMRP